ncbi:DUF6933 domain-containing protein [Slackia exigua]|uniref:DUF6933 domain-containing protein n=1 Tax=Slackia exigua TaxID=84109 RepID=UPI003AB9A494
MTEGLRRSARIKSLPAASESDLFFCWDANRVDVGNKKFLVMMNSANRLCAIMLMSIFDWHRIDELVPQLIADAIAMAGMSEKEYRAYMRAAGDVVLTKTHGRKSLGALGGIQQILRFNEEEIDASVKTQLNLMAECNTFLAGRSATRKHPGFPFEWFPEDLRMRGIVS